MLESDLSRAGFLRAGRIMSLAPGPPADAIWWEHGRIRKVGDARELERQVPSSVARFDFPDTLVTPGFVDGHAHFAAWALNRRRVQLAGARSRRETLALVAAGIPELGWVLGQGWDANGWDRAPERGELDRVHQGPVYLDSLDVHAAWVNSAALRAAGIGRETPDPYGGRIVRDPAGQPTGLLLERAVELMLPHLPVPGPDRLLRAVRDAQAESHRLGITGIHDMEGPDALRTFHEMEQAGDLALRVVFHPPVAQLPHLIQAGARSGDGSEWLGLGGVKLFLDGSLGSRTAWMLSPYEGAQDTGMTITAPEVAEQAVRMAAGAGIAATIHAIGDAAVRRALELLESVPRVGMPHRIEHFQCVDRADLDRAAIAGIVTSMQPAHLLVDAPLADRHWGRRSAGAYRFRSLLERGTPLVFGSDVPVASIDPREGVFAAMERVPDGGRPGKRWYEEERISFEQAVRAYTVSAAASAGRLDRRGTLVTGQDADLVVWAVPPGFEREGGVAFRQARSRLTVVGGLVVMQEGAGTVKL
jgi:predicted amidohydrolase YtcJ